jgi:putative SOS response-associated peptidase YedK
MCGRYSLIAPAATVEQVFALGETAAFEPRWNLAPGQDVPAVGVRRPGAPRTLRLLRWGLVPSWATDPAVGFRSINARAESLDVRPAFRDSFRRHRCLLPASGFYEWAPIGAEASSEAGGGAGSAGGAQPAGRPARRPSRKQAYLVRPPEGELYALAALWAAWRHPESGDWLRTCAVITVDANPRLRPIHDRMPAILPPAVWDLWLDPAVGDPALLQPLLTAAPEERTLPVAVGAAVNRVENDGPECWQTV